MLTYRFLLGSILALVFSLTFIKTSRAQDSTSHNLDSTALGQVVRGTVLTDPTEQPVIGAKVMVLGTKIGAKSKTDGTFRIPNVPVGRYTIAVIATGFEPTSEDVLITSGKQVVLNFKLTEKVYKGAEVVVNGKEAFEPINEAALSSATSFTVDDVKRFAGSQEDPARMAQNFAGVSGTDDQRNDIIIRGGSPLELLWRLDGIDIPNPNHFATEGATGGPVSAINVNLLSNSDFLTGAFPAEYGDKISGVFDLHTREGNTEKYEFVAQLGFAGVEALAEGPIPGIPNSSFIVSYRKSTLEVFNALGIKLGFVGVPKYDDLTFKADMPLGPNDALSLISLLGTSDIDLFQSTQPTFQTGDFDITNGTDLGVAGATWKHLFSERTIGFFSVSWEASKYRTTVDSLTSDGNNHLLARDLFYNANSTEGYYSAKYRLSYSSDASNVFSGGIEGRIPNYNLNEFRTTSRDSSAPYSLYASGNSLSAFGFVNWLWRPLDAVEINSGVHFQYLDISKKSSFEPRLSAKWSFDEGQSLNFGFGVHRQSQPLVIYFGNPANQNLDFTQSIHYVLGYENRFASDAMFKFEVYYKDISHAPVDRDSLTSFSLLNAGSNFGGVSTDEALVSRGLGRAYGAELTLMKHYTDNYYITSTASLFRQQFTGSDGVWRNGAFDNRFIFNVLAGYDWILGPKLSIEFSGKFTIAGGAAYTPIDTALADLYHATSQYGTQYYDESQAFGARYPIYSRLDLRVEFRQNFGSFSIISFVTAENVLNEQNVLTYEYDPQHHDIKTINQLGIFPYGGFRVEF
jgi:hypothetical protein